MVTAETFDPYSQLADSEFTRIPVFLTKEAEPPAPAKPKAKDFIPFTPAPTFKLERNPALPSLTKEEQEALDAPYWFHRDHHRARFTRGFLATFLVGFIMLWWAPKTLPGLPLPAPPPPPLPQDQHHTPPTAVGSAGRLPAFAPVTLDPAARSKDPIPDFITRRWMPAPSDFLSGRAAVRDALMTGLAASLLREIRGVLGTHVDGPASSADDGNAVASLAALVGDEHPDNPAAIKTDLHKARARALHMARYRGHFPLPASTTDGIMALLDVDDVLMLTDTLNLLGRDSTSHSFEAALKAPGAKVAGSTTRIDDGCFAYSLTFTRHAFAGHENGKACLAGSKWILASSANGGDDTWGR